MLYSAPGEAADELSCYQCIEQTTVDASGKKEVTILDYDTGNEITKCKEITCTKVT